MAPVGPLKLKRTPEPVRRKLEVAAAEAWEAVVDAHAVNAARFVGLTSHRLAFDDALDRYLSEMDVREPMTSAIRSRVLTRMEAAATIDTATTGHDEQPATEAAAGGLKRFRPDVLAKGIARKVRETEAFEETVALAIARAEEGVLLAHIENAVGFSTIVQDHLGLDEAVEDYIDLMRITGGRAQSVYQRTMARLADLRLPAGDLGTPSPG
jgi:hypothetical protein